MSWNDYLSAIGIGPQYSLPGVQPAPLQSYAGQQGVTQGQGLNMPMGGNNPGGGAMPMGGNMPMGGPSAGGLLPPAPTASQVFANAQSQGGLATPVETGVLPPTPGFRGNMMPNPANPTPGSTPTTPQLPQDPLSGLSPIQSNISDALKKMGNPDVSHAIPLGNSQFMGIDGSIIGPQDGNDHGYSGAGVVSLPNAMNPSPFNQVSLPQALSNFAFTPSAPPPSWSAPSGSSLSQGAGQPGQGLQAFLGSLNKGSLA